MALPLPLPLPDNNKTRLFGLDLSQWPRQWRGAIELLLGVPGLRALTAPVPVHLLRANGQLSGWWWLHGVIWPPAGSDKLPATAALALELPADAVLERSLTLPLLNQTDVAEAVALEAASISPFAAEHTVWGFAIVPPAKGASTQTVHMALTSHKQIEQHLALAQAAFAQAGISPHGDGVEVWVLPQMGSSISGNDSMLGDDSHAFRPIVFKTGGEAQREALVTKGRAGRIALVGLAVALLAAIAVTPVWQARSRALQAAAALEQISKEVAPQMAQREALVKQAEALRSVGELLKTQLAPLPVLDLITHALPDTAWLTSVRIEGDKAIIGGYGDDAGALVQLLSRQDGVMDVRLPSPATRQHGAKQESFTIEIRLDAGRYGVAKPQETQS